MEMTTGLTMALILVAIAVLMQAGAMLGIYLAVRKVPEQIEGVRTDVKQRIDPLSRSIVEIVNNSREPLQTISNNLVEISTMLRDRAANADAIAADLLDKSRTQIHRVDQYGHRILSRRWKPPPTRFRRACLCPSQKFRQW